MSMQKFLGRSLGLGRKINGQLTKITGVLMGCKENKVVLKISGLPQPVDFEIGQDKWVPFYLGPAIPADCGMEC